MTKLKNVTLIRSDFAGTNHHFVVLWLNFVNVIPIQH